MQQVTVPGSCRIRDAVEEVTCILTLPPLLLLFSNVVMGVANQLLQYFSGWLSTMKCLVKTDALKPLHCLLDGVCLVSAFPFFMPMPDSADLQKI